jgi:hypothetical protein
MVRNRWTRCRRQLWVLGCAALLPVAGWGEGAVRLFDCTVVQVCDAAGNCEAATAAVAFRMEPVQVDQDGSGRYELQYADTKTAMSSVSHIGPFVWTVGEERHALLASSETNFLWHRLTLDPVPAATVRFLTCTIRQ